MIYNKLSVRGVVSFVSAAWYALLGSLGVGWSYCVFSRCLVRGARTDVRVAQAASERSLRRGLPTVRACASTPPARMRRRTFAPPHPSPAGFRVVSEGRKINTYRPRSEKTAAPLLNTLRSLISPSVLFIADTIKADALYLPSRGTIEDL